MKYNAHSSASGVDKKIARNKLRKCVDVVANACFERSRAQTFQGRLGFSHSRFIIKTPNETTPRAN